MYAGQKCRMITDLELECCIYSALLGEVYTTPKPGLVDCHDTGAHRDMDVHTFERSTEAITPYIARMFYRGYNWSGSEKELFARIRKIGLQAEQAMYESTDGINTHKGLIFTMGILAAAAGNYYQQEHSFDTEKILKKVSTMTTDLLEEEFQRMAEREPVTHGEILFREYGEKGIRGEAQKGFPIIEKIALPVLRSTRRMGMDTNRSNIQVLLSIMAELNDTNVWSRGSYQEMQWLKEQAAEICSQGGVFFETGIRKVEKLNRLCIEKKLSPGGAADLLAASLFLYYLENFMQKE